MISRLSEEERAERGVRVTPALHGGRPGTAARTKAMAQAKAAAHTAAQAKAKAQAQAALPLQGRNRQVRARLCMQCSCTCRTPPPFLTTHFGGDSDGLGWLAGAKRGRAYSDAGTSCDTDLESVLQASRYNYSYFVHILHILIYCI